MIATAGPERMVHLEQPNEIHDELFPHLARANVERFNVVRQEVSALQPPISNIADAPPAPDEVEFQPASEDVLKNIGNRGRVDIQSSHNGKDGVVYARLTLDLKEASDLTVTYGVDAPAKVWVNGVESGVISECPERPRIGEFQASGQGIQGTNTILFAIQTNQGKATGVIPAYVLS